jgi:serine protease inhibitor
LRIPTLLRRALYYSIERLNIIHGEALDGEKNTRRIAATTTITIITIKIRKIDNSFLFFYVRTDNNEHEILFFGECSLKKRNNC